MKKFKSYEWKLGFSPSSIKEDDIPTVTKKFIEDFIKSATILKREHSDFELYLNQLFLSSDSIKQSEEEEFNILDFALKEMAWCLVDGASKEHPLAEWVSIVKYSSKQENKDGWVYVCYIIRFHKRLNEVIK